MERVDLSPEVCPRCAKVSRRQNSAVGSLWITYKLIDTAPACGCGNCGYIVYLTKLPPVAAFYVNDESRSLLAA